MWVQHWREDSYNQISEGDIIGWASSEEEALAKAKELATSFPTEVTGIEDLGLFDEYWWPTDWPGNEDEWEAWAVYVAEEDED